MSVVAHTLSNVFVSQIAIMFGLILASGLADIDITGRYESSTTLQYERYASKLWETASNHPLVKKYKQYKDYKDKYDQTTCVMCLEKHRGEDLVAVLQCGHVYHQDCHTQHITSCPVCRFTP